MPVVTVVIVAAATTATEVDLAEAGVVMGRREPEVAVSFHSFLFWLLEARSGYFDLSLIADPPSVILPLAIFILCEIGKELLFILLGNPTSSLELLLAPT
jgi:hypothetical protein